MINHRHSMHIHKWSLRTAATLISLLSIVCVHADTYRILRLTNNNVNIGGRSLTTGGTFDESALIKWNSPNQQMEAKNIRTGAIHQFSARQFASKKGIASAKDFFLRVNKASTRKADGMDIMFRPSTVASQFPERRVALLIANTNYTNISSLRNPIYDASAMANTLLALGFDVYETYDCDYADMTSALNLFASKCTNYDVAMFYYSGHGLQEEGQNYLIPVTANLEFKSELSRCMNAYDVLERIESSGINNRIICLDACRDVKTNWTRSAAHGLTTMEGKPGTAVICSTRSGQVALDGETDNSPFTSAFINTLAEKGRGFSDMMSRVVQATYKLTNSQQCPIVNGTLLSDFIFNPAGTVIKTVASAVATKANSTRPSNISSGSAIPAQRPQPAPNRSASVTCDVPGLTVNVSQPRRFGKNVHVDVVFINNNESAKSAGFVGIEPCGGYDGYVTAAWDNDGNVYEMERGRIAVYKGDSQLYGQLTMPSGVPVKVKLVITNVPSSITEFPMLSMAFRGLMPHESYGQALIKARNLQIINPSSAATTNSVQKPSLINVECDVPGLSVGMSPAKRMGRNLSVEVVFLNHTESAKSAGFVGVEPCGGYDGYMTAAWDSDGNAYEMERGGITVYKGNSQLYGQLTLPPGTPVKVNLIIQNVPGSVNVIPMLSMAFRGLMPHESYGQALMKARNLPVVR